MIKSVLLCIGVNYIVYDFLNICIFLFSVENVLLVLINY